MRAHLLGTLVALATWQLVIGQENLLRNPSFENEVVEADWKGAGFLMERVTDDVYDGTYAIKCSQRDRGLEGPIQIPLNVTQGKTYQFEGHFKLLNGLQGKLWQTFKIVLQYTIPGVPNLKTYNIALSGFGTPQRGWFKVEGSMAAPSVEFTEARLALRGPDPEVAFLADDLKLYEIPEDSSWRAQSYQNIEDHRKGNINVM
ncbi:hypothetical protein V1264_002069 [Littorina saxatilis]|uniref:CBM-cenC domain-containing protein n=2 Tax=Littorina saxatilis TaxID=31220 RepID=A0AAN9C4A6_9CAEN